MSAICKANCEKCEFSQECQGCKATCGEPFGGKCVAAEYIKVGGEEAYAEFKGKLLCEVNDILTAEGIAKAEALVELPGKYVNLPYMLPGGESVQFLDDRKVYLGCQIEFADRGICYGVVCDTTFILICSYSVDGSLPELLVYKRR